MQPNNNDKGKDKTGPATNGAQLLAIAKAMVDLLGKLLPGITDAEAINKFLSFPEEKQQEEIIVLAQNLRATIKALKKDATLTSSMADINQLKTGFLVFVRSKAPQYVVPMTQLKEDDWKRIGQLSAGFGKYFDLAFPNEEITAEQQEAVDAAVAAAKEKIQAAAKQAQAASNDGQ